MITLTRDQQDHEYSAGAHGYYIKLSPSLGVKVIHSPIYRNKTKAYKSFAWREARLEARILDMAFETGIVPRCYGATIVRVKGGYRLGVLMQHLGNKTLGESAHYYDESDISVAIHEKLEEIGIYHQDLHEDNIMVYRGKFYAIDFSPNCVTLEE